MEPRAASLVRPGLVGRTIRLSMAALMASLILALVTDLRILVAGTIPYANASFWPIPVALVLFTSVVVNELAQRNWGQRPLLITALGAAAAAATGSLLGPGGTELALGIYLWAWAFAFAWLLGSAMLLAGTLPTPGCEMRSFAHLAAKISGRDASAVACPGWIDRFDHVRILGRW